MSVSRIDIAFRNARQAETHGEVENEISVERAWPGGATIACRS